MGLFDFMNTGDPEKDSMIREGLLQFGLGLMSSRGRTLPAIGNAGRQSLSAMDAYKQRQFQGKLNDYQLKQLQQAEALSKLPGKYITPGSPEVQGNNPSAYTPAVPESMDMRGLASALMAAPGGLPTGLQIQSMLKKDQPQFHSVAKGAKGVLIQDGRQVGVIENPDLDPEKVSPLAHLIDEQKKYPQGSREWKIYEDAIIKTKTHTPPISVTYGAPIAVDMPGGGVGLIQPPNRAGEKAQLLTNPATGRPAVPSNKDKPLTESQAKAAVFVGQMKSAEEEISKLNTDNTKLRNQLGVAAAGTLGGLGNAAASPNNQRSKQAQEQWAEAYLRFKTGAATNKDEVARNIRTFFPQPLDSKEVIAQKERMRARAVIDVGMAAGHAIPTQKPDMAPQVNNDPLGLR